MIYLDHCASTPMFPEVIRQMGQVMACEYANPGALHGPGNAARALLQESRRTLAQLLGVQDQEVYFTSGGTESNNWAIRCCCRDLPGRHLVISAQEHKSVLEPAKAMEAQGYRMTLVRPDANGRIDPAAIENAMEPDTVLVSVQAANNETGVLQDIDAIASAAHRHRARFHCDAVQSFCHVRQALSKADLITLSAHKLGGPTGIGCLAARYPITPQPLIYGGGQESGLRSGTENVAAAAGFALAARLADAGLEAEAARLDALKKALVAGISALVPDLRVIGGSAETLPGVLNLNLPGMSAEELVMRLDLAGICVSPGAACSARSSAVSHVLLSMGMTREEAAHCVRISLGHTTTEQEIQDTVRAFSRIFS